MRPPFNRTVSDVAADPAPRDKVSHRITFSRRAALGFLLAILSCHAALSFHALAAKTFWFDEGVSVGIARLDWYNFMRILWRREANMSLYYVALRFWLHFGSSPFYVRSLSVLFSLGAVAAIYFLGRRLFGTGIGLAASALLAFNAWELRYAQEARSYSLMVLLCTLSTLFFVRYLESSSAPDRTWYVVLSALAVYAHFFSVLLVGTHWLWLRISRRERAIAERKTFALVGICVAPVLCFVAATGAGPLNWVPRPGLGDISKLVLDLSGNGGPLLVCAYLVACLIAFLTRKKRREGNVILLALWLIVPIGSILVVSFARPLFVPRYFLLCLPALVLLAAVGVCRINSRFGTAAALVFLLVLSARGDLAYYHNDFDIRRDDWRSATGYLRANASPDDAILFHVAMARMPYEYYRDLDGGSNFPEVVYPRHGGNISYLDFVKKPEYAQIAQELSRHRRVWLVVSQATKGGNLDETAASLAKIAGQDRPQISDADFGPRLKVLLYDRDAAVRPGSGTSKGQ